MWRLRSRDTQSCSLLPAPLTLETSVHGSETRSGVNRASPRLIFNISTSSCEPRCYRPFVVVRSQMGQFPRKAKCKIISPIYLSPFFITFCAYPCLPLSDTVIGLNKQIDCEYLMSTRSTSFFCFLGPRVYCFKLISWRPLMPGTRDSFVLPKRVSILGKKSRRLLH